MEAAQTETPRRSRGIAAVSATTFVWGLVPLVLKQAHMPALSFAAYRLWMGVIVWIVVFSVTGRRLSWKTLKTCAPGGVLFAFDVGLSFMAFRLASVAEATIIGALAPVLIMFGAARWFGEHVQRKDLLFVAASFAGVVVVAAGSAGAPTFSPLGDVLAAAGVFSWSAYWLFSKRARASVGPVEYMASVMLVAAVLMTAMAAVVPAQGLAPPRGVDWAWIWLVTLVPGAMGHVLLAWSHRHVEAWLGSLISQCQPVVATVAAWLVLGETLGVAALLGGVVVLVATATLVVRASRRRPEPFAEPEIPAAAG